MKTRILLALLAALPSTLPGCKGELVCASGRTACAGACLSLDTDPSSCGACGQACGPGEACLSGGCSACAAACSSARGCSGEVCRADLFAACPASSELLPRSGDLRPAGPGRSVSAGLVALAGSGGVLYAASGYPAAAVDLVPVDPRALPAGRHVGLAGTDLEGLAVHGGAVLVSNASVGALDVLSLDGTVLDEVPLGSQQSGTNPHGLAFVGSTAFVALYGYDATTGQAVGVVDLSGLAACTAPDPGAPACGAGGACGAGRHCVGGTCRIPCGAYAGSADLLSVSGSHDLPGLPFPSRALAVGSRVYVTLANLELADLGGGFMAYVKPAGSGRLAVLDAASPNAVSIVDLGPSCGNPGGLALQGTTLWVSCGSFSYAADWPGRLVPVEIGGAAPAVGAAVDVSAVVPNGIVFCGAQGYVPDQASGKILPFDPIGRTTGTPVDVCPVLGYAYVADIACAP